jgi:hypothetical protein
MHTYIHMQVLEGTTQEPTVNVMKELLMDSKHELEKLSKSMLTTDDVLAMRRQDRYSCICV